MSTGDSREVEEVVDRDEYAWIYNAAQPLNKLETGECSTNVSDIRVRHSTSSIKLSRSIVDKDSTSALREDFTTMTGSHFCVTKNVPMTLPWILSLNDGLDTAKGRLGTVRGLSSHYIEMVYRVNVLYFI